MGELVCHVSDQGDLSDKMDVKQENIVSKVDKEMHNFKDDQEINSSEDKKGDSEMNMDTIKDGKLKSKNEVVEEKMPNEKEVTNAKVVDVADRVDASTDQI